MGNLSLLKLSFPSPQVTPMPAAIDLLCSDILPDGLALSPEMAVVAIRYTERTLLVHAVFKELVWLLTSC